jgi:nucleoside 2-deoxyribosyltransferase
MGDTNVQPRVYLAGPEVFLPDAVEIGARKVAMCAAHGLSGLFPLDQSIDVSGLAPEAQARAIALGNEQLMRSADALIANLTPFRGVSMDCGTAFEVGFMRALGRPVFGYTTSGVDYRTRVDAFRANSGDWRDGDSTDCTIEDFGLAENLMIDVALRLSGHAPLRAGLSRSAIGDLGAFERCLAAVAATIRKSAGSRT